MPLTKIVNGAVVAMSAQEEAEFEASRTPTLAQAKAAARAAIRARRIAAEEAGVTIGARTVDTSAEFRSRAREIREWLQDNPGAQVPVRLADGRTVRVTAAQFGAAIAAVRDHVRACMDNEAAHSEAVDALGDVPGVLAYDVSTGWPA